MRFLAVIYGMLLIFCVTTWPARAASGHACAPFIPPPVTGPLQRPPATPGILLINEALAVPHSVWNCTESRTYTQQNDSWVEIYNPQNQAFDLYAARLLLDTGPGTSAFFFPFGAAIAAHGYLVVFPATAGGGISLSTQPALRLVLAGVSIDEVQLPILEQDQSYQRIPDGGSNWFITQYPTIGASNGFLTPTPTKGNTGRKHTTGTTTQSADNSRGKGGTISSHGFTPDSPMKTEPEAIVVGKQPAWGQLHLPPQTPAIVTTGDATSAPLPLTSPPVQERDVPRTLLLSALAVGLVGALYWCWRLFQPPSRNRGM